MIARVLSVRCSVRGLEAALIVVLMLASPSHVGAAHKFHASLTQIEVNANSKTVEVGIRVFVDDLEEALTRRAGRRVRLGTTSNFDALALAYVGASLKLDDAAGKRLVFAWIGKETSVDVVWLYVEAPLATPIEGGRLENSLFFELFDDQVNTVNIKDGRRRSTLTFSTGDGAKPLSIPTDE